jgi:AcrR family transcriptional regulator
VPRISAPTLAEHRTRQRAALLAAVEDVVVETGSAQVTVSAVAARAGLARSSVYEYFPSPAALVAAAVADRMAAWGEELQEQVAAGRTPDERVERYVTASLDAVAHGAHRFGRIVSGSDLPPECVGALLEQHRAMNAPLVAALRDLGDRDPERTADLVRGVVQAATARIEAGGSAVEETAAALAFVRAAVSSDRRTS